MIAPIHCSMRLYINNLAYVTTEHSLAEALELAGPVESVHLYVDAATGRSKRCAIAEIQDPVVAEAIVSMWNGKDLDGCDIAIKISSDAL